MRQSAGLLVYRKTANGPQVLIAHMGGPWFANKDKGGWSIPKGEYAKNEDPLKTAFHEFEEELGKELPKGELIELGTVKQSSGKEVIAWAIEGDLDVTKTRSNRVKIEWPPKSGNVQEYPEIDRAEWFSFEEAAKRLVKAQVEFLERLAKIVGTSFAADEPKPPEQKALF
jgi:predicted NUDIX family NTP pyrophosphohydrolase